MKFTLKDYQEEAVGKVLENLKKATKRWQIADTSTPKCLAYLTNPVSILKLTVSRFTLLTTCLNLRRI